MSGLVCCAISSQYTKPIGKDEKKFLVNLVIFVILASLVIFVILANLVILVILANLVILASLVVQYHQAATPHHPPNQPPAITMRSGLYFCTFCTNPSKLDTISKIQTNPTIG